MVVASLIFSIFALLFFSSYQCGCFSPHKNSRVFLHEAHCFFFLLIDYKNTTSISVPPVLHSSPMLTTTWYNVVQSQKPERRHFNINTSLIPVIWISNPQLLVIPSAVFSPNLPFTRVSISPLCLWLTAQDNIKQQPCSAEHMLVKAATAKCSSHYPDSV